MFVLTALIYPCVLALLCAGAGLLVDRLTGGWLPGMLLAVVGAAALIAISQLSTYIAPLAPATPYAIGAIALAGLALGRDRLGAAIGRLREPGEGGRRGLCLKLAVGPIAYAIALAPVLAAGRPTFSSYQALTDSAVHMLGADYLMRHGQDYAHLDLRNSYGQYIHNYYGTSYPSGADTLFGGTAYILGLPLIWALQPFAAFVLALATGPAWVLARRIGPAGGWAALAAITATVPALVYGYELVASVKELVALGMILTLGALVAERVRWLAPGRLAGVAVPGLVLAAGVAALGVGFGAWALPAAIVLGWTALGRARTSGREHRGSVQRAAGSQEMGRGASGTRPRGWSWSWSWGWGWLAGLVAVATGTAVVGALSTWADLGGSLRVAQTIASTANPGNLQEPLHPVQALGTWLSGSYQTVPHGWLAVLTYAIAALTLLAAVLGAARIVHLGEYALGAWMALTVVVGVALLAYSTAWVDAKTIMLTSPVLVLAAWAGIAGLRAGGRSRARVYDAQRAGGADESRAHRLGDGSRASRAPGANAGPRVRGAAVPIVVAAVLIGGIGISDAMQYHTTNLAPTARYEELASIDSRFAGRGPALFVGFDEYALYVLRDLDIGGLEFTYPPVGLHLASKHGAPVDLDHVPPAAWAAYPLVITTRDPSVSEPPAAYRLAWQGTYYEVWTRWPGAPAAIAHLGLSSARVVPCSAVRGLAQVAQRATTASTSAASGAASGVYLVAARPPELVMADVAESRHPSWTYTHPGLLMTRPGQMSTTFVLPHAGVWDVWLKGELMPSVTVSVDGRTIGRRGGELDGNPHNPSTMAPLAVRLTAGTHRLSIVRGSETPLAPGEGGWAILHEVFLTPAGHDTDTLRTVAPSRWQSLCGERYDWIEAVRDASSAR